MVKGNRLLVKQLFVIATPHAFFVGMNRILIALLLFFPLTIFGQNKPTISWDYGLNANFNVAFIKPAVSDSFTNKSGFGAGLMLEAQRDQFALQIAPNFYNTSYISDRNLAVTTMAGIDLSLDLLYTPDEQKSIYFVGGVTGGFNLSHIEKKLDGSKSNGLSVTSVSGARKFDPALKLGFSLPLTEGWRFHAHYYDFLNGTQKAGKLQGRIDYLQFGVQIRFNEFMNGELVANKEKALIEAVEMAQFHRNQLTSMASIVFVLPNTPSTPNKEKEAAEKRNEQIQGIYRQYKAGNFVVIGADQLDACLKRSSLGAYDTSGAISKTIIAGEFYVARIGEHFIAGNSNLSWGIVVYNRDMQMLNAPFPYFIPYRNVDKTFNNQESFDRMISELSRSIVQP